MKGEKGEDHFSTVFRIIHKSPKIRCIPEVYCRCGVKPISCLDIHCPTADRPVFCFARTPSCYLPPSKSRKAQVLIEQYGGDERPRLSGDQAAKIVTCKTGLTEVHFHPGSLEYLGGSPRGGNPLMWGTSSKTGVKKLPRRDEQSQRTPSVMAQ